MAFTRKKIYLFLASDQSAFNQKDWQDKMPEISIISDLTVVRLKTKSESGFNPKDWQQLAKEILHQKKNADGFVILHDLDNILYASSAVSFLLANFDKPVIFTGSPENGGDKTEIRANLLNACQAAGFDLPEVCLMYGNRLLRANQAEFLQGESLNIFTAPASGVLGKIDFSIRVYDKLIHQPTRQKKFLPKLSSEQVAIYYLQPLLDQKILDQLLMKNQVLIINAGEYQTLSAELFSLLQKNPDKLFAVWSKKIKRLTFNLPNLILINQLTWETATAKMLWARGQTVNIERLKELMGQNIAGELNS